MSSPRVSRQSTPSSVASAEAISTTEPRSSDMEFTSQLDALDATAGSRDDLRQSTTPLVEPAWTAQEPPRPRSEWTLATGASTPSAARPRVQLPPPMSRGDLPSIASTPTVTEAPPSQRPTYPSMANAYPLPRPSRAVDPTTASTSHNSWDSSLRETTRASFTPRVRLPPRTESGASVFNQTFPPVSSHHVTTRLFRTSRLVAATPTTTQPRHCTRNHVRRLPLNGICPICHEDELLSACDASKLVWCRSGCGRTIHKECMLGWIAQCGINRRQVNCPVCRGGWDECDCEGCVHRHETYDSRCVECVRRVRWTEE
jgi:hypothetical protein